MKNLSITEARYELMSLPDKLGESHETVTVTRRGKSVLAIIPWEEYEAIMETLEIMSDRKLMVSLNQSAKEMKQGKLVPWEGECARLAKKLDALKRRGTRKAYVTTDAVRRHLNRLMKKTGRIVGRVDREGGHR